ncbi:MAG TPA: ABC transporter ATP-binding protein [Thermoanaerobaculaceae bacterium]|nr:ABC transporter ATP-binding protein [Thermoanaerobaculaceae bacterium]HPS76750.1 ABC transporter ATP-binding protein [Thermoanaerobaculaceae bacterium]
MSEQPPAFSVRGLSKKYPGFTLGPLDLDLEPGRVLGFVGPNGSGKTTTLHCMIGLQVPDAGRVEICGRANGPEDVVWRQEVGFVGDEQGFWADWTVARNLAVVGSFQPRWSAARVRELARRFELPLDHKVKTLSRGNRAKLALVAALGHAPRLLLLDEPTAGLDPVVRAEVLDVLWEVLEDEGRAIFYSTHVLSDIARLADELVFLRDGRVLQRSVKDELVEAWRRVSFRLATEALALPGVVSARQVRAEHQVITCDHEATLAAVRELGAESIEVSRLSVDEIAVEILKGRGHVDAR